jgi:hypothetical protein
MPSIIRCNVGLPLVCFLAFAAGGWTTPFANAAEKVASTDTESIRAAVNRSLPLLAKSATISSEKKSQCFTCHNQGLPIFAMSTAAARGFEIDRETLKTQLQFTAEFLDNNRAKYLQGKGQGGQAHTAGYALWTLETGGGKPNATSAAVTEYLLLFQKDLDHWKPQSDRPPSEGSHFATTYVALRALKHYGAADQRERIDRRVAQVRGWLTSAKPKDTEDRVFQLLAMKLVEAEPEQSPLRPKPCGRPSVPTAAGRSSNR